MKFRIFFSGVFLIFLFSGGCEKTESGRSVDSIVNHRFGVDANLAFAIDSIRDYRCPSDVVCVWAGDVDVFMKFYLASASIDTMMNLNNAARNPVSIGGYSFRINEVLPYPVSNRTTDQKDFKISMTITRE
ncbi:MAG TPA: hypothetical protein PKL65_14305 [Bacteroidales bacterium]|jgi:hypothetical protein|nr:hypothetical protein [Bacteroidales bacterium]HNR43399.1 hypothetical protein [Bacteroidales bacterium]HPM17375.1 hypothetical protein [Bacteroidales bacterium]HQG56384.1 hypothetical protein [Bacteroidales bacterium]HQG78240.1 hypothetical protein [Bacteroidales bacterium]